ncbi:MAG: TIGR04282 family arsenosugar biosynthesis glycosyltransferase [Gammaproteobacteria bacterium]|nr:TIGR04282 family arsenosugar biosynthesis glycosyltransferase [Gammaproteobacteria bacterium]
MSFLFPQSKILVFAKAPVAGKAKTRLVPELGEAGAAELAEKLIVHTIEKTMSRELCLVELWCSPDAEHGLFKLLAEKYSMPLKVQQGSDLGQRMAYAIKAALIDSESVILIGTDCPAMTSETLQYALAELNEKQEIVITPAEDGGYTLIGMNKPQSEIFDRVKWGSADVMSQTRNNLQQLQLAWYELPTSWDIDTPADLHRAQQQGLLPLD